MSGLPQESGGVMPEHSGLVEMEAFLPRREEKMVLVEKRASAGPHCLFLSGC